MNSTYASSIVASLMSRGGNERNPAVGGSTCLSCDALEKAGKLKRVPFEERDAMKKLVDPVMASYAKEIGAEGIFEKINVA